MPEALQRQAARDAARAAGLRYVNAGEPGFGRRRCGRGFHYLDGEGRPLEAGQHIERIRGLAIPPAWKRVWICRDSQGHLQATGYDARGRKQYRYHPAWREVRDADKFHRITRFGRSLPRLRQRVERDLGGNALDLACVLATVVRLLDSIALRIGNDRYASENKSYGLTTLLHRHARVQARSLELSFTGKGGKIHRTTLRDRRLARIVARLQDLPGQRLFQYRDADGNLRPVHSTDVNEYLQQLSGERYTAKDFRTWNATVGTAWLLEQADEVESEGERRQQLLAALDQAAAALNNTRTVCRRSYIHPALCEAHLSGQLVDQLGECRALLGSRPIRGLSEEEARVLLWLESRQHQWSRAA